MLQPIFYGIVGFSLYTQKQVVIQEMAENSTLVT